MNKEDIKNRVGEIFSSLNLESVNYLVMHCIKLYEKEKGYRIDVCFLGIDLCYSAVYCNTEILDKDSFKQFLMLNNIKMEEIKRVNDEMIQLVNDVTLNYKDKWFSSKVNLIKKQA